MQYDADFAGPGLDGTPADQVIFGAEPALWLAFLLLVLLAAAAGFWLGQGSGRRSGGDAAESIWEDIHDAIKAAMKANSHELPGKAARLREVIKARLGQTLKLSGGLSRPLEAIDCALDGRQPSGHRHDLDGHDDHRDAAGTAPHDREGGASAASASASAVITIVTPASEAGDHGPEAGGRGPKPLSPRDRTLALRAALDDLHDHWSVRGARLAELRDAWDELSGAGLSSDRGPRLSQDH